MERRVSNGGAAWLCVQVAARCRVRGIPYRTQQLAKGRKEELRILFRQTNPAFNTTYSLQVKRRHHLPLRNGTLRRPELQRRQLATSRPTNETRKSMAKHTKAQVSRWRSICACQAARRFLFVSSLFLPPFIPFVEAGMSQLQYRRGVSIRRATCTPPSATPCSSDCTLKRVPSSLRRSSCTAATLASRSKSP